MNQLCKRKFACRRSADVKMQPSSFDVKVRANTSGRISKPPPLPSRPPQVASLPPNLSQYSANRAQTVQSKPVGVFSFRQIADDSDKKIVICGALLSVL